MSVSSFFTSLFPVIYADAPADTEGKEEQKEDKESGTDGDEGKDAVDADDSAGVDEEEEEPEDQHPILRSECEESQKCAPLKAHFEHCQEKVHAGKGFKGEDCVEELFHLMHCADNCVAPKLFVKLR